ncbi:MAG: glycosyltransferase [Acidimicrobiales bacterium]
MTGVSDRPPVVVALVAALNRADTVGPTVRALASVGDVHRVVVVDDGSTDATAAVAAAAGATVVRLPANVGKGGAVSAGVHATPDADVYLLVDADVGATAAAAARLLPPVLAGAADMTVGVLAAGTGGGFGLVRAVAGAGIAGACGLRPRAPLSGQRAVRADVLRTVTLAPRFGLETALTIDAVRAGARVLELDVDMAHRPGGRTVAGFAHRGRQGRDVVVALWPRLVPAPARAALVVGATVVGATVMTARALRGLAVRPRPAAGRPPR